MLADGLLGKDAALTAPIRDEEIWRDEPGWTQRRKAATGAIRISTRSLSLEANLRFSLGLVSLPLISCSRPLTDDRLIFVFDQNWKVFDGVVGRVSRGNPDCVPSQDHDICEPRNATEIVAGLRRQLGAPVEGIYVNRKLHNSLWIPIETTGLLSMSSSTRGYVYSASPLTPFVTDTLSEDTRGYSYKPIRNGWMLYVANWHAGGFHVSAARLRQNSR
jgi:hypothetical protein